MAEFRGRGLLKAIVLIVDGLALGLGAFIAIAATMQEKPELLAIVGLSGLLILGYLAHLTNRTFSVLQIDSRGVTQSRLIGRAVVPWTEVGAVFHWIEHQHGPHGGGAIEAFAALVDPRGRRRLFLKSTYPPEMFRDLLESAERAGVRVERRKP